MQTLFSPYQFTMQDKMLAVLLAFVANTFFLLPYAVADDYAVIETIPVGDLSQFLGVNPVTNRIYVTNRADNDVSVIDGLDNTVITNIPVGITPRGVGVNPATNRIYIANSTTDDVSVIDGDTNVVIETIPAGDGPAGQIAVNTVTNLMYVPNFDNNTVSVIDGGNNTVTATIPVGDSPRGAAVNPNTNRIYVSNSFEDTVSVIDGDTNVIVATVFGIGFFPDQVAVNPTTNRIYVANAFDDSVSVIDGFIDNVIDTIPVGDQPEGVTVDVPKNLIYNTNGLDGTVTVIDGETNTVISTIRVGTRPLGIDVNSLTDRVYVANGLDDTVSVLEPVPDNIINLVSEGTSVDSNETNSSGDPTIPIEPVGAWFGPLSSMDHPNWQGPPMASRWVSYIPSGSEGVFPPSDTVVSFFEDFEVTDEPLSGSVSVLADDSTSVLLNDHLVFPEATQDQSYSTCSDFPIGCLVETMATVDLTPFLQHGTNQLEFRVAHRAGDGYGLNYIGQVLTGELLNDLVTFAPDRATYSFTSDTSGCPSGFVGKFGFEAQLTNISQSTLSDLQVKVAELSNGNVLLIPSQSSPIRDQGQIFSTGGFLLLGTDEWSQSITTGITGHLGAIQIQFGEGVPTPTPTLHLSIFDGGNPISGSPLFFEQRNLTNADLEGPGLFTWDLSSANLLFNAGDVFSFVLRADAPGFRIEGNDPPGYNGGELFKNRVAFPELSDFAFITYANPQPSETIGTGGVFAVPTEDGYSDGLLGPAEYVDVPFVVCLQNKKPFELFVDVLGTSRNLLTHTAWEMREGEGIVPFGFEAPYHGWEGEYDFASIPAADDAGWEPAPDPRLIDYSIDSTLCGVMSCREGADFTYFQTFVDVPAGLEPKTFSIRLDGIDDGVQVSVFNSDNPDGNVAGYVFLSESKTIDLKPFIKSGGKNRVLLTHTDDCCSESYLEIAELSMVVE